MPATTAPAPSVAYPSGGLRRIRRPALLVLEDGTTFTGSAFGAEGEVFGEAVFSTGMSGYQETLTDPSYHRQVVVATAPHIGNTGWNDEDDESSRIWVAGYVVRDAARVASSWRSRRSLDAGLAAQGVVGMCDVDTRALTRHLRERGAMRVGISSLGVDRDTLLARVRAAPEMTGAHLAGEVSTPEAYVVPAWRLQERRRRELSGGCGGRPPTGHREARLPGRSDRPRHQVDDSRPAGRTRHRDPRAARDHDVGAGRGAGPRRRLLLERPRRPRGDGGRGHAAALGARGRGAVLRHLLRQPDLRPGARLRHLQAALRPPRDQPAGDGPDAPARSR